MKNNMSLWSFILSLCCIPVFFIAISSASFHEITGIYPLDIVLGMTVITFFSWTDWDKGCKWMEGDG